MRHPGKHRFQKAVFGTLVLALLASAVLVNPFPSFAKAAYDTPTLDCGTSNQTSINIVVTAGPSGAPAGFSLQWVKAADLAANGGVWPNSLSCPASFSGNANGSRYNLGPNESVTVTVGEFLLDAGASTDCPQALECGTEYAFRVFAHATNSTNASPKSDPIICHTLACGHDIGGCTLTQGYWKTHNDTVCNTNPSSPLCVIWPVNNLTLGTVNYSQAQLLSIFNQTPAGGNGLVSLAHQLIAAKLNIAAGASSTPAVDNAIAAADALIGGKLIPPVGTGSISPSATGPLTTVLAAYNEGSTGPGHCD